MFQPSLNRGSLQQDVYSNVHCVGVGSIIRSSACPSVFSKGRCLVTYGKFLMVEGKLQNQENVVSVKADNVHSLEISSVEVHSHDFH
jgi:hypothetical protein